ncbi:hypothetical protein HHX47_DHR6000786 [Lentinula edodes]|nr:hypothetical protein HHX47_DHR6000786 [Lentinula edodes]
MPVTRNKNNAGPSVGSDMKQSRTTNRGGVETFPEGDLDSVGNPFPPSNTMLSFSTRRPRTAKKNVVDHIPRPANAFMLFRSDFLKQRHKPGSLEINHCSLSKTIGTRWKLLTDEEKAVWYSKATIEKAKHQEMYPEYRYRPSYRKKMNQDMNAFTSAAASMTMRGCDRTSSSCVRQREDIIAKYLRKGTDDEHDLQKSWHYYERNYTPSYSTCSPITIPTLPLLSPLSNPPSQAPCVMPTKYRSRRPSSVLFDSHHDLPRSVPLLRSLHSSYPLHNALEPSTTIIPASQPFTNTTRNYVQPMSSLETANDLPMQDSNLSTDQRAVPSTVLPSVFSFDSSLLEVDEHEQPYRTPDKGQYRDLSSNSPFPSSYMHQSSMGAEHRYPNNVLLGDSSSTMMYNFLHGSPFLNVNSEVSSRSSTEIPPPMEKELFQIYHPQAMQ